MPVNNTIAQFRKVQIARESTRGTEVPAVRIMRIRSFDDGDPGSWRMWVPDYFVGRMGDVPDAGEITRKGYLGRIETALSFEDVLFPFMSGLKGGFTLPLTETTGGQGDMLWAFKVQPNAADPAPYAFTMERRYSDGTNSFDRTGTFVMSNGIEISASQDDDVTKLAYDIWGRTPNNNAITASLTLPTPFDIVAALDWKLYINNTVGAIGSTNIATTLKSFTWRYNTGISGKLMMGDGRLDAADYSYSQRGATLELECEVNSAILHSTTGERAQFENGAKRYIRLEALGSQIGTGLFKRVRLDASYIYNDNGFGRLGSESEGKDTVRLSFRQVDDSDTYSQDISVVNTLANYGV